MTIKEKLNITKNHIRTAMEDYWRYTDCGMDIKESISETFIKKLAEDSLYAKKDLRTMLRKHPSWNEELDAVVINSSMTHEPNIDKIKTMLLDLFMPIMKQHLAKKQEFIVSDVEKSIKHTQMFDDISNSILFFTSKNEEEKTSAIESIKRLAPDAYAPGKKVSRVLKALCIALGIADETANSSFQKQFAIIADELSAKKISYQLYISINPAHFLTMSNPKYDSRGSCLTSCHSLNSTEYDYNNGCTGYARDKVTMIVFTAANPSNPESLNNRKTSRQLFMYQPNNGVLLQSRMYNTSGGTTGAQAESKEYRSIVQKVISQCEEAPNLWHTVKYTSDKNNIIVHIDSDFGGYADWECPEFYAKISVRKDHEENAHPFTIGAPGICLTCGKEIDPMDGLFCRYCTENAGSFCEECREAFPENELVTVYDEHDIPHTVCQSCRDEYYANNRQTHSHNTHIVDVA